MNWYKSAKKRYGSFRYDFDGIELMNPICFCSGTADVEFSIERDPGDRYEPPTTDVDLNVTVESLYCTDAEGEEIPVTNEMAREVEAILRDEEHLREKAFDHEFD